MRLSLLFFLFSIYASAQEAPLTILFNGLESSDGKVMLRIKDEQGKVVLQKVQKAQAPQTKVELQLSQGSYAVSAFHDENNNDEIDRSFSGIPSEKYGFSNDARGVFGPPDLEDQLFEHRAASTIEIQLK